MTTKRQRARKEEEKGDNDDRMTTVIIIMALTVVLGNEITRVTNTVVSLDGGNSGCSVGNRLAGTRDYCTTGPC